MRTEPAILVAVAELKQLEPEEVVFVRVPRSIKSIIADDADSAHLSVNKHCILKALEGREDEVARVLSEARNCEVRADLTPAAGVSKPPLPLKVPDDSPFRGSSKEPLKVLVVPASGLMGGQ